MGWFKRNKADAARVQGTAQVVSTSMPPNAATHGSLSMDLVVQAPGIPAYAHEYKKLIMSVAKWPWAGTVLPVTIDPNDHDDVDIDWDAIPSNSERARERAEQIAEMARGAGAGGTGGAMTAGAQDDLIAQLTQMFPGAEVTVGPGGAPGGPAQPPPTIGGVTVVASQSGGDPVERLSKLVSLRDAGIIDADQFEQLRCQIIEQSDLD
jgi:hypothetical protein